ncbi:DTYMK [Branchiostoma lanceolatum]|uniref:Thymidylate kinase n=2 Tax=Branchiostoma lanceolatum TaxID=7740 RepID=A0A8K0EAD2_BRALA|nr:DTYMK [Branchiostoma lanceolatum]
MHRRQIFKSVHRFLTCAYSHPSRLYNMASARGALIVLEGVDHSGKTTQCMKLVEALKKHGQKAELIRFPDRTTAIGSVINDYLGNKCELHDFAIHLLFSANRWEAVPRMEKLLSEGTSLIVDRYAFSGVAFTAAKGLDMRRCQHSDIGLPRPDLVIYLTLPPEEAAKRSEYGGERYEQTDFQKKVAENFKVLQEDDWKILNANQTIEELHTHILQLAKEAVTKSSCQPILPLWKSMENGQP